MLLLVRHGEDQAAARGRLGDEGLSERGREQARVLAQALAALELRGCLSSPLLRARETAELLTAGRGIEPGLEPDLAEGSVGALEGLTLEQARSRHPDHFAHGSSVVARLAATGETAPGGESRERFLARAARVAKALSGELSAPGDALLVVSHGGLLNYALQHLLGLPPRDSVPFGFDHCGVVRVLGYSENPSFGPFPMLRFGVLSP